MPHTYTLKLTEADCETIAWIGDRYAWSDSLSGLEPGVNVISEWAAWEIFEACEADTAGGHTYFPCLDADSDLARKLISFLDSIV